MGLIVYDRNGSAKEIALSSELTDHNISFRVMSGQSNYLKVKVVVIPNAKIAFSVIYLYNTEPYLLLGYLGNVTETSADIALKNIDSNSNITFEIINHGVSNGFCEFDIKPSSRYWDSYTVIYPYGHIELMDVYST